MMTGIDIPFNRASVGDLERTYVAEALSSGRLSGDGPFTERASALLERLLGAPKVLLTTSCTHALEMSALLLDIGPDDEVIVPSFAFVSTANAFRLHGGRPRFADVRRDTLNLDETRLESLITSRTKAIVALHYGGIACDMEPLQALASRHDLAIVEDNAHGLFATYDGRPLGTFGCLATQSFHETKNVTCGEGGALVINDPRYIQRAEILREKGTDRQRFLQGQVDKYTWVDRGSSYLPADVLAALLLGQLEERERIQATRRRIWLRYAEILEDWADENDVRLPVVPERCGHSFHLFHMILPSPEARERLITHLQRSGILAVFHYQPLHLSKMGTELGGRPGDCPVTEWASERLVRLPLFADLTWTEQARVTEAIWRFQC